MEMKCIVLTWTVERPLCPRGYLVFKRGWMWMEVSPEQKLLVLMVLLERSELRSQSFPSSSEVGDSDTGDP